MSDVGHAGPDAYGAYGEKKLYGKTVTGVIRSTVVVDPEGTVLLAQYNVKATGHVAKLRRDLRHRLTPPVPGSLPRPPGRAAPEARRPGVEG